MITQWLFQENHMLMIAAIAEITADIAAIIAVLFALRAIRICSEITLSLRL